MGFLKELFGSKRVVLMVLAAFSLLLWLATAISFQAGSTLFIVLFGLTALCVSIYAVLYAVLTGGTREEW